MDPEVPALRTGMSRGRGGVKGLGGGRQPTDDDDARRGAAGSTGEAAGDGSNGDGV